MIIAVDFDGTCVEHEYPTIGENVPGAVSVLRALVANGHQIILWTMRDEGYLRDAEYWFECHGIPLFGVNRNPEQHWSASPKAYANLYIDDAAVGCPLMPGRVGDRPMVDWALLLPILDARAWGEII